LRGILASYRWRRRLWRLAAALTLVVGVVLVIVLLPEQRRASPDELGGVTGKIQPVVEPSEVPLTAAERRAVNRTLLPFVASAVTRDDPAAAWDLVTPAMRSGISRSEWNRGDLPVVPYPVAVPKELDWTVVTSYPGDLTLDLVLQPRRGSHRGAASFFVEMKRAAHGRWLVDSMYAEDVFGGGETEEPKAAATRPSNEPLGPHGRLSPAWIAVPLGLLGLVIVVPVSIGLLSWRRQRAIDRRYRA
jgi:hypothetical protein